MNTEQIGLQLYTLRSYTASDMRGTLRQLAEIGYRAVELAGYGNLSPHALRAALDELSMRAFSAHVPLDRMLGETQQVLDELHTLGCNFAVVPSIPGQRRATLADARQVAADMNRCGSLAHDAGLQFAYHNHAFEFEPLEDSTLWEVLMAETDPALVALELDVYWAHVGGHDPAALIRQLGQRVPLLHVKDGDGQHDAPIGDGVLPWAEILQAGQAAGVQWYIVEQDHPRDPLNDVRRSFEYLSSV